MRADHQPLEQMHRLDFFGRASFVLKAVVDPHLIRQSPLVLIGQFHFEGLADGQPPGRIDEDQIILTRPDFVAQRL